MTVFRPFPPLEVSGVIHRKTLRGGIDWVLTGPEMAKRIYPENDKSVCDVKEPSCIATVSDGWKLLVDPLYPKNEILVGRNEDFGSSYFYCPYVMYMRTPIVLDPDTFAPRFGLLTRYGKKLAMAGAKSFGKITYRDANDQ